MTTISLAATPVSPPGSARPKPTMCLLHGDFHVMDQDCWSVTVDFYVERQHLEQTEAQNAYQAEVERNMLDQVARQYAPVLNPAV